MCDGAPLADSRAMTAVVGREREFSLAEEFLERAGERLSVRAAARHPALAARHRFGRNGKNRQRKGEIICARSL
jgi:hypothetical protein